MSDEFEVTIPIVKGEGVGVPIGQIQNAINIICQQMQTYLNEIASGGFPLTDVDITGGTIANVAITNSTIAAATGSTAVEQGYLDNSNLIATDSFAKRSILASSATIPINVNVGGGGVYNFQTAGTGAQLVIFATGGVVQSIPAVAAGGAGYQVGDCLILAGGNGDALAYVSSVSSGAITAALVLYGGTAYTTGATLVGMALPPGSRTGALTGALTSNATIIIPAGTYLQGGRRIGFQNNTTGAFTVTVQLSNGAGGSTGTGTVLVQGSNNSTSELLYTDGQNDVWPENSASSTFTTPSLTATGGTLNGAAVGNTTPSTGAFTTLAASGTVSGNGFSTYLASPPAIGGTAAAAGSFTNLSSTGTVSGVGFSNYLLSPPPIGGTTPAAGAFTTLSASSTVSGAGFSSYLASPPSIGGTTPAAGAFTTLNASGNDALFYQNTSAQSIPNNAQTTITTWTKVSDRVNANFNASTGTFTAPATGYYQVSGTITFVAAVGVVNTDYAITVIANGVGIAAGSFFQESTSTASVGVSVTAIVSLTAGQTIVLQAFQNSGSARALAATAAENYLSINRLP